MKIELTAPSHWASYLINGDCSALDAGEIRMIEAWFADQQITDIVDCADAGFCWRHDASHLVGGADCQTYTAIA